MSWIYRKYRMRKVERLSLEKAEFLAQRVRELPTKRGAERL